MGRNHGTVKPIESERKAWLEKLQFLSDAMEATSQPFGAGSPDGSNMIFNEAFCRLTGYSREELRTMNWATDLTTPESLLYEQKFLKLLDATREPQRYEKDYIMKDGRVVPIELFTHAAVDTQGTVLFYYSFVTDISGRKQKEHELRMARDSLESTIHERTEALDRSEERLRVLIETSPLPMVVFGPDDRLSLNKKFVETFGYTGEDIPTLDRWWPLAYPDREYRKFVKARWEAAIAPAIANKTSTGGREVVVKCKDGSEKHVLSYFSSIGDLNLSVFYDITERKHAEEALLNSEAMLAKSQEMAHIGSWVWDVGTGMINRTAESYRIFGLMPGEYMISFDKFLGFIVPEDREYVANQTRLSMKSGMPYDITYRIRRKDGSIRTLHSWGEPVKDASGLVVKMYGTNQDVTERKQAEEVLHGTVQRFYNILSTMRASILLVTGDDRVEFANQAFCSYFLPDQIPANLLGLSSSEIIEKIRHNYFNPDEAVARIREIISRGQRVSGEEVALQGGRTCLRDYIPLSVNGELSGRLWVHVDITERKRAEEALRESEVRFRSLIQNSSDIIRILDRDGRIVYDSPSSEKVLGYPPGYTIGKSPLELIHPDDRDTIARELSEVYEARNPGTPSEFRIRRANGEYVDCESVGVNMIGVPGVDGIVITTRPITERKRAEEARERLLREVEEQRAWLQAVLDALPVGVAIADATGRILMNNDALRKIWGGEAPLSDGIEDYAEYKGWWADTGDPVLPGEWGMARALTGGETSMGEVIDIRRFDGTRGTMLNSAAPVKDAGGKIIGAVVILQDITKRMQMERDLAEAKQQAELYLDLMGHDISNMHQIIMMQLELALSVLDEEGRLGRADREMFTTSLTTLDRSVNLIGNVRMLQKVRSGEYRAEPLDLDHVIEGAVKVYSDIPGRKVTIKYAPVSGRMVMASPLVKDVLANLVDNAIKHSKDPVEIGIGVRRVMYKGIPYYRVAVEDNGIGVPDEKKDLIFQRFKRGQTTAKGTGLGLYIVRTLVEGFGGYVRLEDRVSGDYTKGARFVVYLPAAEANDGR